MSFSIELELRGGANPGCCIIFIAASGTRIGCTEDAAGGAVIRLLPTDVTVVVDVAIDCCCCCCCCCSPTLVP